jgi:hypothetical protein
MDKNTSPKPQGMVSLLKNLRKIADESKEELKNKVPVETDNSSNRHLK